MIESNMIRHADYDIEYRITEVEKSASIDEEKVKQELYDALLDKKKVIEDLREQLAFRNSALEHEIAQRQLLEEDRRSLVLRLEILHPTGNDGLLLRYFSSSKLFNDLVAESVSEAINFMKTEEDKNKLVSKFTNENELMKIIRENSAKIKSEFSPADYNCKNYSYYLRNIYEGYLSWEQDDFTLVGEIQSAFLPGLCLEPIDFKIVPYPCRKLLPTINDGHTMGFTKNFNIRVGSNDRFCWDSSSSVEGVIVIVYDCHTKSATEGKSLNSQYFYYNRDTGQIVHVPTTRCLELANRGTAWLVKCDVEKEQQRWNVKISPWF